MKKDLLNILKSSVGKEDPIVYFATLAEVIEQFSSSLESMESQLKLIERNSVLAIEWDAKVALDMILEQIEALRASPNREIYDDIILQLKTASVTPSITENYKQFCKFWLDTLGFHPFLNYKK